MQSRRRFLRGLLGGGIALGACGGKARAATGPRMDVEREVPEGYAWQKTIFCQFGDPRLLAAIGAAARRIACDLWHGEPSSPDILAIPHFAVILDRNTLGRDGWDNYIAYRDEVGDSTPCIVLDELGWQLDDHMEALDPNKKAHVRRILDTINRAHRKAQNWILEDVIEEV